MSVSRRLDDLEDTCRGPWRRAWKRWACHFWQPMAERFPKEHRAAIRAAIREAERDPSAREALDAATPEVAGLDVEALHAWAETLEVPDLDASPAERLPSDLPEPPTCPTDGQISALEEQAGSDFPAGVAAAATLYCALWARAIANAKTIRP